MKHKHAELIIAWANGAEIECGYGYEHWIDAPCPSWAEDMFYRIKPKPRPQWQQNLIDAAKAGKVVEFYDVIAGWVESDLNKQLDLYNFGYATQSDFRIRPTKVTRYLWAEKAYARWLEGSCFMSDVEAVAYFKPIKCEYMRLDYTATEFGE